MYNRQIEVGKISTRVRAMARTDESASAITKTMTVMGRRRAIRISHMRATFLAYFVVARTTGITLRHGDPKFGCHTPRGGQLHHHLRCANTPQQRRHPQIVLDQTDIEPAAAVRLLAQLSIDRCISRQLASLLIAAAAEPPS